MMASAINMVADPAPLGLGGFAATTFALSLFNAGITAAATVPMVLTLALFYGGVLQVLAGMWEFRNNRNTFGAVAFTSYGFFWLAVWWLFSNVVPKVPSGEVGQVVGTFLLVWTIFTLYMFIGSLRLTWAHAALFGSLLLAFATLTLGAYQNNTPGNGWNLVGGWLGILTAVIAWYIAAALVINATFKRTMLPLFPVS
jgi:succinate-acetate transporter protein